MGIGILSWADLAPFVGQIWPPSPPSSLSFQSISHVHVSTSTLPNVPPFTLQVLVATSTLAWGVNTPAHLVVIKGTEFYDAPTKSYVDFPITDVLQVMYSRSCLLPWPLFLAAGDLLIRFRLAAFQGSTDAYRIMCHLDANSTPPGFRPSCPPSPLSLR